LEIEDIAVPLKMAIAGSNRLQVQWFKGSGFVKVIIRKATLNDELGTCERIQIPL